MIIGIILGGLFIACFYCFKHIHYSCDLNKIESIKYFEPTEKKYAYNRLSLTITEYNPELLTNSLVAKAIYRNDAIGFRIIQPRFKDKIYFKSIGEESDNFVKAISELYDVNIFVENRNK